MKILPDIEIYDLSLFINKKILVISDLQLGYEEVLNKKGFFIPKFQKQDIKKRLSFLIENLKPKIIVINGDIKHEFSGISKTEWKNVNEILDYIKEKSEIVLIKGNHDNMLEPIIKKKGLILLDYYFIEPNIYVCHGHEIHKNEFIKNTNILIIGHEHPAIGLRDKGRVEKFKCFLKGTFRLKGIKEKNLLVLPSFNTLTEGTDILQEKLISPFLKNIDNFDIFVVNDIQKIPSDILYFGKVKLLVQELD